MTTTCIVSAIIFLLGSAIVTFSSASHASPVDQGQQCGPVDNKVCIYGLWCDFAVASCESANPAGLCTVIPEDCRRIKANPVCGCNGKEYRNDCERLKSRVQKLKDGRC
jgi:hypothetical protein